MVLDLLALMGAYLAGSCQRGPATVYAASLVLALHILQAAAQVVPERGHEEAEDADADAGVLKARERRKVVLVLATFAVALIYVAGLSPPGGFWDSPAAARGRGAGYRYRPGESLVEAHHSGHYRMFFYCNTTAFVASLFIVVLLLENKLSARSRTTTRSLALYVFLVGALVGLVAAYTAGSCRDADCSVYVVSLFGAVLAFVFLVTGLVMVPTEFLKRLRLRANTTRSASDGQSVDTIDQDQATKKVRSLVVLLANLAATITYQAGLDPPGGFWPDDGDAVLLSEHPARYKAFFYCNTAAFVASVVAIVMVQSARPVRSHTLLAVMVLDMLALVGAYAAGSCRDLVTSAVVASMAAAAVLLYVAAQVVVSFTRRAPPAGALPEKEHKRLLRETPYMPSVRLFAECIFSETRQTSTLPSVFSRYSANKKHSAKSSFTECQK